MDFIIKYNLFMFAGSVVLLAVYLIGRKLDAKWRLKYADNPLQLAALDTSRYSWTIGWALCLPYYACLMFGAAVVFVWRGGWGELVYMIGALLGVLLHVCVLGWEEYVRLIHPLHWLAGLTVPFVVMLWR